MDKPFKPLKIHYRATYEIRVQGSLPERWRDYVQSMHISIEGEGGETAVTTLTGELADQGALLGVLNTIYDLRLALLSIDCLEVL